LIYRFLLFLTCSSHFATQAFAQNLVPNGGFEERQFCIWNDSDIGDAVPWFNPVLSADVAIGSPDLFHQCAVVNLNPCPYPQLVSMNPWGFGVPTNAVGCENPHSGEGYAGIFCFYINFDSELGFREYLAVPLAEPLVANDTYEVKLWLSLAERSTHAIWRVQVLFTSAVISQDNLGIPIPASPQLEWLEGDYIVNTDGWKELSWNYTAQGGEQYMYLGNFRNNALTDTLFILNSVNDLVNHYYPGVYYYVDDVSVQRVPLSTDEEERPAAISVFPNPVLRVLQITSQKDRIWHTACSILQGKHCTPAM
jgi:hypothetical protein